MVLITVIGVLAYLLGQSDYGFIYSVLQPEQKNKFFLSVCIGELLIVGGLFGMIFLYQWFDDIGYKILTFVAVIWAMKKTYPNSGVYKTSFNLLRFELYFVGLLGLMLIINTGIRGIIWLISLPFQ